MYTVCNSSQNLHSGSQNLKAILLSDLLVRITFIAITNTDFYIQVTVWILLPPLRNVHFSSRCVGSHICLSLDLCCTQGSSWLLLLDTMNPSGLLHHTWPWFGLSWKDFFMTVCVTKEAERHVVSGTVETSCWNDRYKESGFLSQPYFPRYWRVLLKVARCLPVSVRTGFLFPTTPSYLWDLNLADWHGSLLYHGTHPCTKATEQTLG